MRLSDAIHPTEVTTPVKQLYYLIQLVITKDVELDQVQASIEAGIVNLAEIFKSESGWELLSRVKHSVAEGRFYSALLFLKKLFPIEQNLLMTSGSQKQQPPASHAA